jgi:hypothetical protein
MTTGVTAPVRALDRTVLEAEACRSVKVLVPPRGDQHAEHTVAGPAVNALPSTSAYGRVGGPHEESSSTWRR